MTTGRKDSPRSVKAAVNYNWSEMVRTTNFWLMIALLLCGAITGMMIFSQAVGIAVNQVGMSVTAATGAVAFLALINTFGRLAAGVISDSSGSR